MFVPVPLRLNQPTEDSRCSFVGPIKRSGSGKQRDFEATPLPVPLRLNRPTEDSRCSFVGPIKRSGSGTGAISRRCCCRFRCA